MLNYKLDEEDSLPEYYVAPKGRLNLGIIDYASYQACVLTSAFCPCALLDLHELKKIVVPKGVRHVHIWSDSDLERVTPKSGLARRKKHYHDYFPGVVFEIGENKQVNLNF